jgi:ribonuclease Y
MVAHILERHGEPASEESALLETAHLLAEQRPGAADAVFEDYVKRMHALEELVRDVCDRRDDQVHAVRAGKEVRVMVSASAVTEKELEDLAGRIASHLAKHHAYEGEIAVHVFRRMSVSFPMTGRLAS